MKLDRERLLMSLSKTEGESEEATTGRTTEDSGRQTMHIAGEDQLPAKVANVSREELRRYVQCKRVGNYLLGKTVGEGSFAKVKEALHILTGEKVAIKIIDKNRARKDRYVAKNMRREARLLQMIRHPHIVQLLEIVETSQFYYLVFEFADGGDLMDHICKRKKLEEEEVRKFIRQIISAVEYLHRLGIIHRDLKVENLLLDANRNIKIIDFGLSNTIHSPDPKNENHCSTQCGSPAYAAPELLVRKDYGSQIDVWSIGVNLYAMLTGRLPYTVEPFNISTLYNKMLKRQMNVIPDYLSEGCKDFIHQLLNPNPKERINLLDAARHRWITNDQKDPLQLIPCPNYLREEDLEDQILDHVENRLKLNSDEVIRDVIQNRSTKNSCVYHLLVRRLDRYKRDYRDVITSVPRPSTGEKNHISQPTSPPSTNCNVSLQQNSIQEPRSQPKTHIVENPFKTIRVALIRQRKATNKVDKSVATTKPETPKEGSSSHNDRTPAPKLCSVKRVALVKVAPARRSFRGVLSSARNLTSSPMPSRRKNYFEGLQQRRKSPKVRRRRTEIDDSLSSVESNSRQRNTVHSKKATQGFVRRHSEDKPMNESALNSDKNSKKSEYDAQDVYCGKAQGENKLYSEPKFEETRKSLDTVTHFYTDQGVVLKRDPIGKTDNAESNTNSIGDKDHVQCHIFHSHRQETTECAVDRQELRGSDGGSVKNANEKTGDLGKRGRVVNGDISTIQARRGVERLEHINPRPSSGGVASHCSTNKYPQEKPLTPKRTSSKPLTPSKIPVPVGRTCKSAQSPSRLSPNTPSPSTTNPRTVAKNGQVTKLTDKYAKCFSVVVVKSPGKVNESDCTTKPGVSDKNLSSKKESSVGKSKGNQAVAATTSRRINNATVSRKNQVPPKPLTKENPTKCIPRVTNSLTAKHVKKFDEKSNTSQNGVLPRTSKPSRENQTAKAKESIERTQSWSGDERRKISNYRKVTESEHIKGTTRRDIRTAPTNYKIPTSRPCS